jgi:tRNA threonylcarbamoyladenosine biosynthesis protein TsaB
VKLLAFETATEACSVALLVDGEVRERHAVAPRQHATLALPWADELLAQAGIARAQLDAIAVGIGPGAFTGVRLAVALAQGIALGLDRPVVPVSTLAVLAMAGVARASTHGDIAAAIDARMGEVYVGLFRRGEDGLVTATSDETLLAPSAWAWPVPRGTVAVGTGFAAAGGALAARMDVSGALSDALPHAADLALLAWRDFLAGHAIAADALEPAYLRDKVALTLVEQGKA